MPIIAEVYQSSDDRMIQTVQGLNIFWGGSLYLQYGTATVANTTTETTILNPALNSIATFTFGQNLGQPLDVSSLNIPGSPNGVTTGLTGWIPGTFYRMKIYGSIGNTGTPTLRVRTVLRNPTTQAIVYTICDSTALTTSTITGTGDFQYEMDLMCVSMATNAAGNFTLGSVKTRSLMDYAITTTSRGFMSAPWATTAIDTTQTYILDVLVTWGAASASNTITSQSGMLRVEG